MKRLKGDLQTSVSTKSVAAAVAASFALPSDFPPYRMRNEYSTEETALFKVFEEHPAMGLGTGSSEQLRSDFHMEFIFQDLLRNRISYVRNPTNAPWSYQWAFGRTASGDTPNFLVQPSSIDWLAPSHAFATSTFRPHSDAYFAEYDNGNTGLWVDAMSGATSLLTVTFSTPPSATSGQIFCYRWNNGVWVDFANLPTVIAQAGYSFTLTQSGLYAIMIRQPTVAANVIVTSSGSCGCWGHFSAPYIYNNASSIESARTLGHSILVKNVTNMQTKQGSITGVQPGKSRHWSSFATQAGTEDAFVAVRDYAGAANTRPLETGFYGFIKPTEEEDLKLREPFTVTSTVGTNTTFWSYARTPTLRTEYIVVVAQAANGSNPSGGQNLLVRTDLAGEYETSNQFFNVDKPRAEPADWRDGMEALASMQQFYENPTHWKRILSTIGSVASVGGRILSLFGPKGAAVGVPMSMAGDIMKGGFQ